MGLKFRKSFKIAPGVKVNLGKKSIGMSIGGKHSGISINSKSGTRARVSVPGTSLSYSTKVGGTKKRNRSTSNNTVQTSNRQKNKWIAFLLCLFLGFFGAHKFYEGKSGLGILYLLTFGLFGIGWIVDTIILGINILKPLLKDSTPILSVNTFHVAGTYYKQAEIQVLVKENPYYRDLSNSLDNKRIYKYNYTRKNACLIPEPQNEHDSNAIAVVIDGVPVGYVPADLCTHIHKLINSNACKNIEAQIYGGDYKYIDSEGDLIKEKAPLEIKIEIK